MTGIAIAEACSEADLSAIRTLFLEYGASLDFDLCFQGFDEELASLPGKYAAPGGCLLLARTANGDAAGCVGVRPLDGGAAEMKRLYVRSAWRGRALGVTLAERAVGFARDAGYALLRLDTVPGKMATADGMYRRMGFTPTPAYYDNPVPGAVYYALHL